MTIMIDDAEYWRNACNFFHGIGYAARPGTYFFHYKSAGLVKIGIMPQLSLRHYNDPLELIEDHDGTSVKLDVGERIFKRIEQSLQLKAPCFFVVSPDFKRRFADSSLPTILFVQPCLEFTFSAINPHGEVTYARDVARDTQGRSMLSGTPKEPESDRFSQPGEPQPFSALAAGWVPAEDDDEFLKRIEDAITLLQDYPNGKMTLTRGYEYRNFNARDPFLLYKIHARENGDYACSHFFCLDDGIFSLGCSPENKFEIMGDKLIVDIVAATCAASNSGEYLARNLVENPKQIKEHRLSLDRPGRFAAFCRPGSIHLTSEMGVKRLRNVFHLHSVGQGVLLPGVTLFDLLESIEFPVLGARPRELVPLADIEREPHRYYGGLVGHSHGSLGGCFLNIRNALLTNEVIHAKVGVGLLAESEVNSELWETRNKISGLMEAIQAWQSRPSYG